MLKIAKFKLKQSFQNSQYSYLQPTFLTMVKSITIVSVHALSPLFLYADYSHWSMHNCYWLRSRLYSGGGVISCSFHPHLEGHLWEFYRGDVKKRKRKMVFLTQFTSGYYTGKYLVIFWQTNFWKVLFQLNLAIPLLKEILKCIC